MVIYKEFNPHSLLAESIKCFWVLEREYNVEQPSEEVLPDSYIELILNFGERYFIQQGEAKLTLPFAFLIGLLKQPLPLFAEGRVQLVSVRFYPWAVLNFFDGEITQPLNTDLRFEFDNKLKAIIAQQLQKNDFEEAVKTLERYFLERYLHRNFDKDTVNAAAQIIYAQKGSCRIEDLADLCQTTQRTLQRNFQSRLGLSPKSYAGNVRFDRIKKKIETTPDLSLTDLAYEFGYFDQAHFIKDFKQYCQMTPAEFAAKIQAMKKIFADKSNVVFLQSPDSSA